MKSQSESLFAPRWMDFAIFGAYISGWHPSITKRQIHRLITLKIHCRGI
jgi:hypothetical protein